MGRDRDRLDAGIDRLLGGRPADPEPLLDTARLARESLAVEVSPPAAERHLAAIAAEARAPRRGAMPAGPSSVRPPVSRRTRAMTIALAAAVATTLLGASAVAASAESLPGDLLYPVKRAVERANLALHPSDSSRARLRVEFAERRLAELEELIERGDLPGEPPIERALAAYEAELSGIEGILRAWVVSGNENLLERLDERLAHQVARLAAAGERTRGLEHALERATNARSKLEEARTRRRGSDHGNDGDAPGRRP